MYNELFQHSMFCLIIGEAVLQNAIAYTIYILSFCSNLFNLLR